MISPRILAALVVVAVVTGQATRTFSADPPSGSVESGADGATDEGADAPAIDRPKKTINLLDRELLRELVPELPLDAPEDATESKASLPDELDRAVASMRDVTERLDRKDFSEETSRLQTSILDNIDSLIERLKNQPPPQSSPSQSDQSNPDQQNQNRNPEQKDSNASKPKAGTGSRSQSQAEKSEESSETNPREAQERAAALARRRALVNEVWGHLPPAIRERLLNVQSEKLLPGYESMIRRYYESLANSHEAR
jgi:hypothetical protein